MNYRRVSVKNDRDRHRKPQDVNWEVDIEEYYMGITIG
jgi:hypothetical protein